MTDASITLNVPAEDYHRRELGVISAGVLKKLDDQTPAHYRSWIDEPEEANDSPDKRFGRAYHDRVLLPDLFFAKYVGEPAGAPQRPTEAMLNAKNPNASSIERQAFWRQWDTVNAGRIILSAADFEKIEAMYAALMANPDAAEYFQPGEGDSEVTMRWTEMVSSTETGEETELRCKARADRWNRPRRWMADLKTCLNASARVFARAVVNFGYDVTHAHYTEGARECGDPIDKYVIIAQEKTKPYLCAVYELNAAAVARGYEIRARGMATMAECVATNTWPGYPAGIQELELPGWAIANEMEIGYVADE